jgi:alpha-galactosidase
MKTVAALILFALPAVLPAQTIRQLPEKKLFVIETARTTYAVGINRLGILQNVYWGKKLRAEDLSQPAPVPERSSFDPSETRTPEEFPAWGGLRYYEPALKATFADGNRDVVLKYAAHSIDGNTLTLRVKDINGDLFVDLIYHVYPKQDIIERHARIENKTGQVVTLESAQSAVWNLPPSTGYRLTQLAGRWAAETQILQGPLNQGKTIIESRRGNTSHAANPWFALDLDATEDHGRVWFGGLAWSGNYKIVAEQVQYNLVRVVGGFNDFDFSWPLKSGDSLETPRFYAGFTDGGFGEASRLMHRLVRDEILPDHAKPKVRPILYNSWEATEFKVDEAGQTELAEKAAKLGTEMFVVDDGWFGARNHDRAGLGDWVVNKQKFPNGMKSLIAKVNSLGMKFGLWFEPEMVNPDSDLYRAHPDWAMNFPGRPRSLGRNQLVLNMARDDVKEYIFSALDKMLAENNIEFIKWDMNRNFGEPGMANVPVDQQKEIWVKYVRNVYDIFDRLRAKYPRLEIESCSGGGGRADLGILQRVDQIWTSDNTEAFDRLRIQEGFSMAYPAKVMMAWVTDVPNMNGRVTPLKYRFLVAMNGSVGIGSNLNKFSAADMKLAADMVALDKEIRDTVQAGDLYRLMSPRTGDVTANQYIGADGKQSVVFAFLHSQQYMNPMPTVYPQGLDPEAIYKVRTIDNKLIGKAAELSGATLMNKGLNFDLRGDFDSTIVVLDRK